MTKPEKFVPLNEDSKLLDHTGGGTDVTHVLTIKVFNATQMYVELEDGHSYVNIIVDLEEFNAEYLKQLVGRQGT